MLHNSLHPQEETKNTGKDNSLDKYRRKLKCNVVISSPTKSERQLHIVIIIKMC